MGNAMYCFSNKNNPEIIIKSDLNLRMIEQEFNQKDTNILMSSNIKSAVTSQLNDQQNIFINPLPEIVVIKPRKLSKNKSYN